MEADGTLEATAPLFSASMEIPYDLRFMAFALAWTAGLCGLAGSGRSEADALRLASEETLTFLIGAYPDAETWEQLRIEFALQVGGLVEIAITNAGPPVHLSRIPRYNPQEPSESEMDGLWYFLARNAVDDLTFTNLGWDGWRAVIQKRLAGAAFEPKPSAKALDPLPDGKLAFATRSATPDDAAHLVDLIYDTYRYTYPAKHFYHEPMLRQALEERGIVSLVVEAGGAIVGNVSFMFSSQTPRCAYTGSLMIKRAFRQSRAIIHLLKEIDRVISSGSLNADLCYAEMVTTHTGSQKAGVKTGYVPLALLPSLYPMVDFRGMKTASIDRESQLLVIRMIAPPQIPVLYLPARHHAVMAPLLAQAGVPCRLSAEEAPPERLPSTLTTKEDLDDGNACIMTTRLGQDYALRLRKRIYAVKAKGIQTVVVLIPAWRPIPPGLDAEMANLQATFTGVRPISAHEWYLVYVALSGPVNFELIRLSDPLAVDLKDHCQRLFDELVAEAPE